MATTLDIKAIRREVFLQRCAEDRVIALRATQDDVIKVLHDAGIQDEVIADILELVYEVEAQNHKWQCPYCGATHNNPGKPCSVCG